MTEYTDLTLKIVVAFGKYARIIYTWSHHEDCPAEWNESAPCLGEFCYYRADPEILQGRDALDNQLWLPVQSKKDLQAFLESVQNATRPVPQLPSKEQREAAVVAYQQERDFARIEDPVEDQVMSSISIDPGLPL